MSKGTKLTIVSVLPATISRTGTLMPHVKAKVSHLRSIWKLIKDDVANLCLLLAENGSKQSDGNNFFFVLYRVFWLPLLLCLIYLPEIHSLLF